MAETYKVKVLAQKVFHDGVSMIVLNPKNENPEVEHRFIAGLVEEGIIEKPKGFKVDEPEVNELASDAEKASVQDGNPPLDAVAP